MSSFIEQPAWLSLGQASRLLGVSPSTLRYWADSGRVRCFRTPGGHRRFTREALVAVGPGRDREGIEAAMPGDVALILDRSRAALAQTSSGREPRLQGAALEAQRESGRQLLGLTVQYLARRQDTGPILAQARELGAGTGRRLAAAGYDAAGAVEAFYFFADRIEQVILPAAALEHVDPAQARLRDQLSRFFRQVLLAVLAGYEEARAVEV